MMEARRSRTRRTNEKEELKKRRRVKENEKNDNGIIQVYRCPLITSNI